MPIHDTTNTTALGNKAKKVVLPKVVLPDNYEALISTSPRHPGLVSPYKAWRAAGCPYYRSGNVFNKEVLLKWARKMGSDTLNHKSKNKAIMSYINR